MVVMVGDRGDGGEGVCAYNMSAWHPYTYSYGFLNCYYHHSKELRNREREAGDPV